MLFSIFRKKKQVLNDCKIIRLYWRDYILTAFSIYILIKQCLLFWAVTYMKLKKSVPKLPTIRGIYWQWTIWALTYWSSFMLATMHLFPMSYFIYLWGTPGNAQRLLTLCSHNTSGGLWEPYAVLGYWTQVQHMQSEHPNCFAITLVPPLHSLNNYANCHLLISTFIFW